MTRQKAKEICLTAVYRMTAEYGTVEFMPGVVDWPQTLGELLAVRRTLRYNLEAQQQVNEVKHSRAPAAQKHRKVEFPYDAVFGFMFVAAVVLFVAFLVYVSFVK